ncbi:MAG: bifunctional glutamate N-acetyltransferase/amino-acid acetyltransferase ArgJ [Pseudonocardiales bacterium]
MPPVGPRGFRSWTGNIGLKDSMDDVAVVLSEVPAVVSAMFTRSRFAGPSVVLSRMATSDGKARGVVVVSRNANVATGRTGQANAQEVRNLVARAVGQPVDELLIASTGVIGRQYPMDVMRRKLATLDWPFPEAQYDRAASAMMTTDTVPKYVVLPCGRATVAGIAKGVGMIEPKMATMLAFFFTDAAIEQPLLDDFFRRVVERTFNALSIDTDTSTSDTAAIFANGLAGAVDAAGFESVLYEAALRLVRQIAADGEGASKLIEVRVTGAGSAERAKRVGKAIVNSPLVKTAVYGADPNWGRVAMAIGKCEDDDEILPDRVTISFGGIETYPAEIDAETLARAAEYLAGDEIIIDVDLGIGPGEFTVYGCDLTEGYIRINADYTT